MLDVYALRKGSHSLNRPATRAQEGEETASLGRWRHAEVRGGEEEESELEAVHMVVVALPMDVAAVSAMGSCVPAEKMC